MPLLDRYIKGKKKPKQIMAPFRAAKDAGAIGKLTKSIFIKTYGNILGNIYLYHWQKFIRRKEKAQYLRACTA